MPTRATASQPLWPYTWGRTFRFLRDPQRQFPSRLDAQALPKTFLVDRSGSIVQTWKGWEAGMEVEFEEAMRELSKK